MAEFIFRLNDVSLTTTWTVNIYEPPTGNERVVTHLEGSSETRSVLITGLPEGEYVKRAIISATFQRVGTTDYKEQVLINQKSFYSGTKKLDASEFSNGVNWSARFYYRASGEAGPGVLGEYTDYNCILKITDITLTLTTGTGGPFDGEVSSLPEGTKFLISEPNGVTGTYTLIHHNYNPGLCLLWRDTCISHQEKINENSDHYSLENYGLLDAYLTNTFYTNMPAVSKKFIQQANYPTLSNRTYGGTVSDLYRYICTPSIRELGSETNAEEWNGFSFDYLGTKANGEIYWTRSIATSDTGLAYRINGEGNGYTYNRSYASGVRPCFCVLETQLAMPSTDGTSYILINPIAAPTNIYLNGGTNDLENLQRDSTITISWDTVDDELVQGYEVYVLEDPAIGYVFYGAVEIDTSGYIPTSLPFLMGPKGYAVKSFKVKAIADVEFSYLDSPLSTVFRTASTKKTNLHYYNGQIWLLADINYYNGSTWIKNNKGAKYYNGSSWIIPPETT